MGSWINPNENVLRICLTKASYADNFIKYGRIKFNTPQKWADYAKDHGDGRDDCYEGTLAFCHFLDVEKIVELNNKYSSSNILNVNNRPIERLLFKERILYKDKRSMCLPCYCLYLLKVDAFSTPNGTGVQILTTSIDGSYFRDFVDNQTKEQVERMPEDDQPSVIVISDFDAFKGKLIKELDNMGVCENDILVQYSAYFDFDKYGATGWYDFQQQYPKELFIKNKRFEKQSEGRIVIKTGDPNVLQRLEDTIDLGDMNDIASVFKGYYPDGLEVKVKAAVLEKQ